jgi:integrase
MPASFSLHRRKDSSCWFVSFRTPHPEKPGVSIQRTRSTKQESKAEAYKAAATIVHAVMGETGASTEKGRKIFAILSEAAKLAEAGKLNVAAGRELLGRMIESSGAGAFKRYSVKDWFTEWLDSKRPEVAKPGGKGATKGFSRSTFLRYVGVIKQLLEGLPTEKTDGDLLALTADDLRHWRDGLRTEGRSAATCNDALKIVRTALTAARKKGILLANVAEGVDTLRERETIRAVFAPEDVSRLIEVAPEDWKGAILLGWHTGASLSDACNLRWSQINLESATMVYSRTKTGRGVSMPLHPDLLAWLMDRPQPDDPKSFVFPSLVGRNTAGKSGLSGSFRRIMERAGIEGDEMEAEGGKGRKRRTLSFHSLRHSFVSSLANAGVSVELRQELAGHASAEMNLQYTHREIGPLRSAIESLPGLPRIESLNGKKPAE